MTYVSFMGKTILMNTHNIWRTEENFSLILNTHLIFPGKLDEPIGQSCFFMKSSANGAFITINTAFIKLYPAMSQFQFITQ